MSTSLEELIQILEIFGTAVFAISGALAAGRKGLDFLGVIVISIVTAIGGGTLRDLLLDRNPIFWIAEPQVLIVIIISSMLTILYVRFHKPPFKALLIADAIGLAVFTISGAQIAEAYNANWLIIVVMASMTGTAGGVIRDVLSNDVPLILRRDIYATASIGGAVIYLAINQLAGFHSFAIIIGILTVLSLRFMAIIWGLRLPVFRLLKEPD